MRIEHQLNAATRHINVPERMKHLPINDRGYLVPWFVAQIGEREWDFRAIGPGKIQRALLENRCWLCGGRLGVFKTFVAGPMCGINRVSAEPPSHKNCARYAVQACPFLTQPKMIRNEKNMPEDASNPGGVMIKRNPGVSMLWTTQSFTTTPERLIRMGPPTDVEWWAHGRHATRAEVAESVESGLPILADTCGDDEECHIALGRAVVEFAKFMPKPDAVAA